MGVGDRGRGTYGDGESGRAAGWYAWTGELERELSDRKKNGDGGWMGDGALSKNDAGIVLRRSFGFVM